MMRRQKAPKYDPDQLMSVEEAAKALGYSLSYMKGLVSPGHPQYDRVLGRMKIQTDETWRKAFSRPNIQYVWRYGDLVKWFNEHQELPTVKTYNQGRGIIVE